MGPSDRVGAPRDKLIRDEKVFSPLRPCAETAAAARRADLVVTRPSPLCDDSNPVVPAIRSRASAHAFRPDVRAAAVQAFDLITGALHAVRDPVALPAKTSRRFRHETRVVFGRRAAGRTEPWRTNTRNTRHVTRGETVRKRVFGNPLDVETRVWDGTLRETAVHHDERFPWEGLAREVDRHRLVETVKCRVRCTARPLGWGWAQHAEADTFRLQAKQRRRTPRSRKFP